jgi:hypothetical protein
MKKIFLLSLLLMTFVVVSWAVPRPMESITNYNVMLLHGAYGHKNDDGELQGFEENSNLPQAYDAMNYLGNANIGRYVEKVNEKKPRLNQWLRTRIFEEPVYDSAYEAVHNSCVYHWRAFSLPPNSSIENAIELGNRTWNADGKFGGRRALVEEAQEVKTWKVPDSLGQMVEGQKALQIIRQNPDLYRQLASRYILIGHSMGGVVAREYTQNSNYYYGYVDKIITLDSPHEGTGALEMQLNLVKHGFNISESVVSTAVAWGLFALNTRYSFMSKMVGLGAAILGYRAWTFK